MTATTDRRTPAQRLEDARDAARRPLIKLLDWLIDAPRDLITTEMRAGIVSRWLGHKVTADEVRAAVCALKVRNAYLGDDTDHTDQVMLDTALDDLLDLADCADCCGVHPSDEVRRCDHGTFGVGTYPDCWSSFHGGRSCPSEHLS